MDGKYICVTVYDSVGVKAAQCLPGSIIFIMGVDIDGEQETNNNGKMWAAFCSKKSKGEVFNGKKKILAQKQITKFSNNLANFKQ